MGLSKDQMELELGEDETWVDSLSNQKDAGRCISHSRYWYHHVNNDYPGKHHFIKGKVGFAGVCIIFLICVESKEAILTSTTLCYEQK